MNMDWMDGISQLKLLPEWLLAPLQKETFIASLGRHVPEFASGEWSIQSCKVKRFFLKDDSGRWEGTYHLKVRSGQSGLAQDILVHGTLVAPSLGKPAIAEPGAAPFGSPGWRCFLPELCLFLESEPPDKELPGLEHLTDPEQSRMLLENALREKGRLGPDCTIKSCNPRILSYKLGSRCTIRYDLEYSPPRDPFGALPSALIGKVYRKGSKAQNAFQGMSTLWHSPLAGARLVTIAEPIAWLPEYKLVLQAPIPGETSLEDLLRSTISHPGRDEQEKLNTYMRKASAGLAAFHRSGADHGEHAMLQVRFAEIHELAHRLAVVLPQLEQLVLPLLERLEELAAFHPDGPAVPTHGTFNPEQVLIDGRRIGFIDFDDYCVAEPALDVGLFLAAIKDTGMNAPFKSPTPSRAERLERLAFLDALDDVFLAEYEARAGVSRARVALWQAADYLRNCLHYWIKVKPAEPDHAFLILDRHLQKCRESGVLEL
jgi:hypothetical protein